MKRIHFLISLSLASLLGVSLANATVHTVTVQNTPYHFLPVTVNAVVGDTIRWVWVEGNHIVGPISASDIPSGAAMFNATVDAGNPLEYVVTVPGNYHYVCHPAFPHGEDAFIVVADVTTDVPSFPTPDNFSFAAPNPFSDKITIEAPGADLILIYNLTGKKVKSFLLKSGQTKVEIDLADLMKGIYFCGIIKEGLVVETKKLVKN